jgi:hypothetical protein
LHLLNVTVTLTSDAPGQSTLRVSLEAPDGVVIGSTESDGFATSTLPAGDYAFVIEQLEGALIDYKVEAHGVWDLQPPPSFFSSDETPT